MSKGLFNFVITFFAGWGWQAMGKTPNPATGKIEKNLDLAKEIIQITEMLKEKTKGNLTEEEEKLLTGTIAELQLNYVEELKKEPVEKQSEKEKATNDEQEKDKGEAV